MLIQWTKYKSMYSVREASDRSRSLNLSCLSHKLFPLPAPTLHPSDLSPNISGLSAAFNTKEIKFIYSERDKNEKI